MVMGLLKLHSDGKIEVMEAVEGAGIWTGFLILARYFLLFKRIKISYIIIWRMINA